MLRQEYRFLLLTDPLQEAINEPLRKACRLRHLECVEICSESFDPEHPPEVNPYDMLYRTVTDNGNPNLSQIASIWWFVEDMRTVGLIAILSRIIFCINELMNFCGTYKLALGPQRRSGILGAK